MSTTEDLVDLKIIYEIEGEPWTIPSNTYYRFNAHGATLVVLDELKWDRWVEWKALKTIDRPDDQSYAQGIWDGVAQVFRSEHEPEARIRARLYIPRTP